MNLVVARDALAGTVVQKGGIRNAAVAVSLEGRAAAENPQLQLPGGLAQEILHRARAVSFRDLQLIRILEADEREVLRQTGDLGASIFRLAQESCGGGEIVLDHVTRGHLNCGYCSHHFGASAVAVAASALLMRSI